MRLVEGSEILLLASHDFVSMQSLCDRGIVLHHGEVAHDGPIADAILQYNQINKLVS